MAKKSAGSSDSDRPGTRRHEIPAVDRILESEPFRALVDSFARTPVREALAGWLDDLRHTGSAFDLVDAAAGVRETLAVTQASTLRRVINGSGVVIHTNLGRAPIDAAVWAEAQELMTGYTNLELDLDSGERGRRDEHLSALAASLFGCDAALLTNNNAAGTLLLLAAVASGGDVLVSRGELVEIGGGFRVPDVIQQGGARLKEVGTTNRTRAADYAAAAGRRTAAMLRVHRSNFEITGFTETPTVAELVETARAKKLPLLYDEGSGRIVDLSRYGFSRGETLRELLGAGVDAVTCSTDKLIGATQGGLILGRSAIIESCRKHPLMRAVRAGKETYAVVAATLRAFAAERQETRVPIYRMLATPLEELHARGVRIAHAGARLVASEAVLGGGTTPTETIASWAVEVPGNAEALARQFREGSSPILGRIREERFLLDVRTILPEEDAVVASAVANQLQA